MKCAGIIAIITVLFSFNREKTVLDIEISNVRNQNGIILVSLYTSPEQYPYHPAHTYQVKKDSLEKGIIRTSISDLAPGRYGLCLLDDENRSGDMESNRIGLPLEGFGFANNAKPFLKRPDYDRIQFSLAPGINRMKLIVRYKN